jgi:hypothetical protein
MIILFFVGVLVLHVVGIIVPLQNNQQRCMIVFTFSENETVKFDMNFPPIPGQLEGEAYQISYQNTDNNHT